MIIIIDYKMGFFSKVNDVHVVSAVKRLSNKKKRKKKKKKEKEKS